jgi:hypothetical protein
MIVPQKVGHLGINGLNGPFRELNNREKVSRDAG